MKSFIIFLFLVASINYSFATDVDCNNVPVESAVFNLCPFAEVLPFNVSNQNFSGGISFTLGTGHVLSCDGHENIWALYYDPKCVDLAIQSPNYSLISGSEPEQGIILTFPESDEAKHTYQLIVILSCNKEIADVNETQFQIISTDSNNQRTVITIAGASKYGCPVLFWGQLINFLENNKRVFGAVFAIIGICLLLFGAKIFDTAIFLITAVLTTLLISTLAFELTDFGTRLWVLWTIFGASLLVGLALGYVALKSIKFGFFVVGVALGVVAGLMIYNALILPFLKVSSGTIALYITIILCGLVAGVIAIIISNTIVIVATSLIGAYLLVRGLSVFIGGFPTETAVAQGLEEFSFVVYGYLVTVAVLAGFGIFCQYRSARRLKSQQETQTTYDRYE